MPEYKKSNDKSIRIVMVTFMWLILTHGAKHELKIKGFWERRKAAGTWILRKLLRKPWTTRALSLVEVSVQNVLNKHTHTRARFSCPPHYTHSWKSSHKYISHFTFHLLIYISILVESLISPSLIPGIPHPNKHIYCVFNACTHTC